MKNRKIKGLLSAGKQKASPSPKGRKFPCFPIPYSNDVEVNVKWEYGDNPNSAFKQLMALLFQGGNANGKD